MAYNTSNRSERLLQGRRFTTDNLSLTQEAFTDVFDLGAGEIFTDDGLIPTGSTQLAYSGSSQNGGIISGSVVNPSIETDVNVLKYHYRKKLKQVCGKLQLQVQVAALPASQSPSQRPKGCGKLFPTTTKGTVFGSSSLGGFSSGELNTGLSSGAFNSDGVRVGGLCVGLRVGLLSLAPLTLLLLSGSISNPFTSTGSLLRTE